MQPTRNASPQTAAIAPRRVDPLKGSCINISNEKLEKNDNLEWRHENYERFESDSSERMAHDYGENQSRYVIGRELILL